MLCVSDLACISLPRALSHFIVLLSHLTAAGYVASMAWLKWLGLKASMSIEWQWFCLPFEFR